MKICNQCKIEKEEDQFNKKKNGLQDRCKTCNSKNLKIHYHNNKQAYKDRNKNRKLVIREYVNSFKTECSECGENHIACLDFHHLGDKEIDIASLQKHMWSNENIKNEIDKCIILCANCHRKLHYNERNFSVV